MRSDESVTVVQCDDKKFYYDPTWHGKIGDRRYFINRFQDFELTVEAFARTESIKKIVQAHFEKWPMKIGATSFVRYGVFPPNYQSTDAFKFKLTFEGMPPKPTEWSSIGREPDLDFLRWCWEVTFPTQEILLYMASKNGTPTTSRLGNFLTGSEICCKVTPKAKKLLKSQFPRDISSERSVVKRP